MSVPTRYLSTLLALTVFFGLCSVSIAQERGDINAMILGGLAGYGGDNDLNPTEGGVIDGTVEEYLNNVGFNVQAEIGYHLTPILSANLRASFGKYPTIESRFADPDETRLTGALLFRVKLFNTKVSPYVQLGGHLTEASGKMESPDQSDPAIGYGPAGGIGLMADLGKVTLALDAVSYPMLVDEAVDGANPEKVYQYVNDETDRDFLTLVSVGAMFNLNNRDRCSGVQILSLDGPTQVEIDQAVNFSGAINENATAPVETYWDFGDGTTSTGTSTSHSFSEPGSYVVSFSANNCGGLVTETMTVEVTDPCADNMPTISDAQASLELMEAESGVFSLLATGDDLTYAWDFGDGTQGSSSSVSHSWAIPGRYTVKGSVSNVCGEDSRTFSVVVKEDVCALVSELNTVYFDFRSKDLDETARNMLDENVDLLVECPDIDVDLFGYSDTIERSQPLSLDRAMAVRDYYLEKGLPVDRIRMEGRGVASPACTKEDPGPGCRRNRRVESVPILDGESKINTEAPTARANVTPAEPLVAETTTTTDLRVTADSTDVDTPEIAISRQEQNVRQAAMTDESSSTFDKSGRPVLSGSDEKSPERVVVNPATGDATDDHIHAARLLRVHLLAVQRKDLLDESGA